MRSGIILMLFFALFQPIECFAAETQESQRDALALEVFQMTQSLDELIQLIKSQQSKNDEYKKLQAAISYLSFRSRNIEMQQYELKYKEERKESIVRSIERTKEEIDKYDDTVSVLQTNGQGATKNDISAKEERLKILKKTLEDLDTDIIKLKNQIQSSRDELSSFEAYVQERLKLID